jgi:hypothetical protein
LSLHLLTIRRLRAILAEPLFHPRKVGAESEKLHLVEPLLRPNTIHAPHSPLRPFLLRVEKGAPIRECATLLCRRRASLPASPPTQSAADAPQASPPPPLRSSSLLPWLFHPWAPGNGQIEPVAAQIAMGRSALAHTYVNLHG